MDDAQYILDKIQDKGIEQFTKVELKKACRRFKKNDELSKPLELLEKHGYFKITGSHVAGNKITVYVYTVNPYTFQS